MAYRAAIIGCGRVAWMLEADPLEEKPCTHMGAYRALEGKGLVKVVAGADIDEAKVAAFSKAYDVDGAYVDYKLMLSEARPEIVSISAYATERQRMVMDAIEAGVKGIWCEKAFATSLREATEMTEACKRSQATLIVSHMRRWSANYVLAKRIIDSGEIGEVISVVAQFGGSLLHTGTHAFDILNWFCGPAEWVQGELEGAAGDKLWDLKSDPGGRALIQFKNGSCASVLAQSRRYFHFEFDITGTLGRIRIGNNVEELYLREPSRRYTGIAEIYPRAFPEYKRTNIWIEALSNLIASMEGKERNRSTPEDGYSALELALAVHVSARNNNEKVFLPLDEVDLTVRSR